MLHDFIEEHREVIISRTRERVRRRVAPLPTAREMLYGVPLFLEQLVERLRREVADGDDDAIGASAVLHGSELLEGGFTIGQVVHDYGDICQAVTELASDLDAPITVEEYKLLNLCLDVAIAEAVGEFARQRERAIHDQGVEDLGFLAHELRNLLNTATLAFSAVRSGQVGIEGSTGALLARSLVGMNDLVNRSLAAVRLQSEAPRRDRLLVARVLEELEIAAAMQASGRDIVLSVEPPEAGLALAGDAQIVSSILTNLLQNACKFTAAHGHVTVRTSSTADRVSIEVADECGGLPPGDPEDLFRAYEQRGADRSGLGLGLAISLRGARALGGDLRVSDLPGTGCVFTLELPRSRTT